MLDKTGTIKKTGALCKFSMFKDNFIMMRGAASDRPTESKCDAKKRELMPSLSLLTLFIHQRNRLVGGHVGLNETNYIW